MADTQGIIETLAYSVTNKPREGSRHGNKLSYDPVYLRFACNARGLEGRHYCTSEGRNLAREVYIYMGLFK